MLLGLRDGSFNNGAGHPTLRTPRQISDGTCGRIRALHRHFVLRFLRLWSTQTLQSRLASSMFGSCSCVVSSSPPVEQPVRAQATCRL